MVVAYFLFPPLRGCFMRGMRALSRALTLLCLLEPGGEYLLHLGCRGETNQAPTTTTMQKRKGNLFGFLFWMATTQLKLEKDLATRREESL
jgi:hypothetical protein